MRIEYNEEKKVFRFISDEMEYAFAINNNNQLINIHWGAPVGDVSDYDALISDKTLMNPGPRDCLSSEYRSGEAFDFGVPCIRARFSDGSETLRLKYTNYKMSDDTLIVTLCDSYYPIEIDLCYQVWKGLPLIGRKAIIKNLGKEKIQLLSAKSATLQMPKGRDYRLTHFAGEWGAEYQKQQVMVTQSRMQLESNHLTAAACYHQQFFALDENGDSTETSGEVYFGILQWSGDFQITVELQNTQSLKQVSVTGGISDFSAQIPLGAGDCFETPVFIAGYSNCGFEHMSEILYDFQYDYILPRNSDGKYSKEIPIIYNTWYPYEFNIDEKKVLDFIPKASSIGAELFVIDDGWMKGRTDKNRGLGDWFIDSERFNTGFGHISDEAHKNNMLFGLWVEPEMVNPDSDLYRKHPDWILSEPNRQPSLQKCQYILDMSRDYIRDWTIDWLDELIINAKLDYLKWDMNRVVSEIGLYSLENGTSVKYMRNVMSIWKHINKKFPNLLLENCAAGGGRADFEMAQYSDRINRSDNADPIDLMLLHEGFSTLFVPKLAGGAGNVSPSPNGINGRSVPLEFRTNMGMTGSMSIGINILKSDEEELKKVSEAVSNFKELRPALHNSYLYRIASATQKPYCVWEYLKRDRSQFTIFAFGHNMHQWDKQLPRFRVRNLKESAIYSCGNMRMSGAALMNVGIDIQLVGDYSSKVMTWKIEML